MIRKRNFDWKWSIIIFLKSAFEGALLLLKSMCSTLNKKLVKVSTARLQKKVSYRTTLIIQSLESPLPYLFQSHPSHNSPPSTSRFLPTPTILPLTFSIFPYFPSSPQSSYLITSLQSLPLLPPPPLTSHTFPYVTFPHFPTTPASPPHTS